MHLLVVIICEHLQISPSQNRRYPWLVVLSRLMRIWGECRRVITHFTSRDIWNRYPIPDPSQYIFLKHNTRPAFPSLFPLSQNTSFCLQQLNTTRQSKYRRDHMCFFFWTRIRRQKQKEVDWISVSLTFNHLIWSLTFDNLSLQATFILGYIYFLRKGN